MRICGLPLKYRAFYRFQTLNAKTKDCALKLLATNSQFLSLTINYEVSCMEMFNLRGAKSTSQAHVTPRKTESAVNSFLKYFDFNAK